MAVWLGYQSEVFGPLKIVSSKGKSTYLSI